MSTITTPAAERVQHFQQISRLYTNNGWDRLKQHYAYIQLPSNETQSACSVAFTCIAMGAVAGAKTGQKVGEHVEKLVTKDHKRGELGRLVGGGVGFAIGGAVGGYIYMTLTEHSKSFMKWKSECLNQALKEAITVNYAEEKILKNFTCPVSLCVMDIPVHSPSGVIYDLAFLMNCSRESNGNIKDPNKNPSFPESAVIPDFEMGIVIHKRIRYLLKADIAQLENNILIKTSLEENLKEVEKAVENRYENARQFIEERRKSDAITHQQYKEEIEEFEETFGISQKEDLDWNVDWNQILRTRWKHFYPESIILNME